MAAFVQGIVAARHDEVFRTHFHQQTTDGRACRAAAVHNDLGGLQIFLYKTQGAQYRADRRNSSAVLVIVEYGDIHDLFQFIFNVVAFRGRNVFQVDGRKGSLQRFYDGNKLVGIFFVDADRNRVHTAEPFEQDSLAFHNRHGSSSADVAQAQHAGTVGADTGHIAAAGVLKGHVRGFFDFLAGFRHAGRIGNRQIVPVIQRRFAANLHFAVILQMHFQGLLL